MEDREQDYVQIGAVTGFRVKIPPKTFSQALPDVYMTENPVELQEVTYSAAGRGVRRTYSGREPTFLEFTSSAPPRAKLHKHDYFELMLILSQRFEMQIESQRCEFHRGDVCILDRATRHGEHFDPGAAVFYLVLSPDYLLNWPREEGAALPPALRKFFAKGVRDTAQQNKDYFFFESHTRQAAGAQALMEALRREFSEKRPGYQLFVRGWLYRLFCLLFDTGRYRADYVDLGADGGFSLAFSAKQILDRAKRRMTKQELAERLNYNADYIDRVFHRHYGYTVPAYTRAVCLRQAAYLLRSTGQCVHDIAKQVGFVNRTNFYALFAREYGCTPAEYRRRSAPGDLQPPR